VGSAGSRNSVGEESEGATDSDGDADSERERVRSAAGSRSASSRRERETSSEDGGDDDEARDKFGGGDNDNDEDGGDDGDGDVSVSGCIFCNVLSVELEGFDPQLHDVIVGLAVDSGGSSLCAAEAVYEGVASARHRRGPPRSRVRLPYYGIESVAECEMTARLWLREKLHGGAAAAAASDVDRRLVGSCDVSAGELLGRVLRQEEQTWDIVSVDTPHPRVGYLVVSVSAECTVVAPEPERDNDKDVSPSTQPAHVTAPPHVAPGIASAAARRASVAVSGNGTPSLLARLGGSPALPAGLRALKQQQHERRASVMGTAGHGPLLSSTSLASTGPAMVTSPPSAVSTVSSGSGGSGPETSPTTHAHKTMQRMTPRSLLASGYIDLQLDMVEVTRHRCVCAVCVCATACAYVCMCDVCVYHPVCMCVCVWRSCRAISACAALVGRVCVSCNECRESFCESLFSPRALFASVLTEWCRCTRRPSCTSLWTSSEPRVTSSRARGRQSRRLPAVQRGGRAVECRCACPSPARSSSRWCISWSWRGRSTALTMVAAVVAAVEEAAVATPHRSCWASASTTARGL
jgi:hypothetical protein